MAIAILLAMLRTFGTKDSNMAQDMAKWPPDRDALGHRMAKGHTDRLDLRIAIAILCAKDVGQSLKGGEFLPRVIARADREHF